MFRQPLAMEGFADGLNPGSAAPLRVGKSTVAEAIRAAFFERHRSGSVEHLRPWVIRLPRQRSMWNSTWARSGTTSPRCSWARSVVTWPSKGSHRWTASLPKTIWPSCSVSSSRAKAPARPSTWGFPGLLWIRQGTSHELADAATHAVDDRDRRGRITWAT